MAQAPGDMNSLNKKLYSLKFFTITTFGEFAGFFMFSPSIIRASCLVLFSHCSEFLKFSGSIRFLIKIILIVKVTYKKTQNFGSILKKQHS